ncbi:ATPase [Halostagnicola kamekurae]|uniref:Predicted P-loop ATPase/GTPase n=1 Tax=Halostagnicola kamekurae TaxID=619731 RepID=A0A1I6QQW5_9EURY|nr:ATPase [Halostagnicola kamekurae]SFS54867.1 Predicted P-loop ATPase/GTPase [Halostagnicola kamekurae]
MNVLVAGGDRVDAGKTTFSMGLLERTGALGYKPRAANDYWFDHDDCLEALSQGRLYGKDAAKLSGAERAERAPEAINPVHRLWQPSADDSAGMLGRRDREFVVDRVAHPDGDEPLYVHNGTVEVPELVAESLPLEDAVTVDSLAELNDLMEGEYLPAFRALSEEIAATELAVVESYGDVARPLESLVEDTVSAAVVVEPGRVRIYDGGRFCRACSVAGSSSGAGTLETRVPDVVDSIEPIATASLPPLSGEDRTDPTAVAEAYESAYAALLEAV